jgi:hypothetical protein
MTPTAPEVVRLCRDSLEVAKGWMMEDVQGNVACTTPSFRADISLIENALAACDALLREAPSGASDTEMLDYVESTLSSVYCSIEDNGEDQSAWWQVGSDSKSQSGHPLGSIRAAIKAAMKLPDSAEGKTPTL